MNIYCVARFSCPAGLFSFNLLDRLSVCLRPSHVRVAPADVGLEYLVTTFMNDPGGKAVVPLQRKVWGLDL